MKDKILNVIMVISILALIGAGYREYLIHNGKLTSDLNANGYSITNLPAGFFPAETDPTVPSWAKEDAPPLPPGFAAVSNAAMTVGAAATNYTDAAVGALDIPSRSDITNAATWAAGNAYEDAVAAANAYTDASISETNEDFVAAVQAASPPVALPQKWALANVTNANGGAVTAANVGAAGAGEVVKLTGDQSISGTKTFDTAAYFNLGLAAPSTIAVYGQDSIARFEVDNTMTGDYVHFGVDDSGGSIGFDYTKNGSSYKVGLPNRSGVLSVKADVAAAATAATNYTDSAIGAAIANTNPVFSNAVLSVGLGIDTNAVAAINALVEAGDELPIGGAATVGGLLLALAAAVAALKRNKADASALRYAMPESVALVAENDAATLVCADRAVTNATIASGFSTLNLTFPAEASGYVRDFYLRIVVAAGQSAPALSLPQGITIENAGGAVPEIADGEASAAATTLVWFSETAPGIFTAKSETVKAVV